MAELCGWDFLDWVGPDISSCVFSRLVHPADLVRAAAVSPSWRRFITEGGFSRDLCLRLYPEAAAFAAAVEVTRSPAPSPAAESSRGKEFRIYSNLSNALADGETPSADDCCILHCIGASSTDNFPLESIENTLIDFHPSSYWSSGGEDDRSVPESLTYRLSSEICVINEIRLQPFEAYFQYGSPIYSSKKVRFRMGQSKLPHGSDSIVTDGDDNKIAIADENYRWTYTSPEFPMLQENAIQSFKLPRPVLCVGGIVKIELLGRVQKQEADDRYYICIRRAQVIGHTLEPVFMVDIPDPEGHPTLKYLPGAQDLSVDDMMQDDDRDSPEWRELVARYRHMRDLAHMNEILGPVELMHEDGLQFLGHVELMNEDGLQFFGGGLGEFMHDDEDDAGSVSDDDLFL